MAFISQFFLPESFIFQSQILSIKLSYYIYGTLSFGVLESKYCRKDFIRIIYFYAFQFYVEYYQSLFEGYCFLILLHVIIIFNQILEISSSVFQFFLCIMIIISFFHRSSMYLQNSFVPS